MGQKENTLFTQLFNDFTNLDLKNDVEEANNILTKMYYLLPNVDKDLVRKASETCPLGFTYQRAIDLSKEKIEEEYPQEIFNGKNEDEIAKLKDEIYVKELVYRANFLQDQIKYYENLDLYTENIDILFEEGKDNSDKVYYYFESEFHKKIFLMTYPDVKLPKETKIPFPMLLAVLGSTLIDLDEWKSAEEVLHKAYLLNITDVKTVYEYAETLKRLDIEKFFIKSRYGLTISYTKKDVARAFRNFAYYYSEKKEWQNAFINLQISSYFENNEEKINAELDYIQSQTDIELEEVTEEMLEKYYNETKMPLGPNPWLLEQLDKYSQELYDLGNKEECLIYLQYLFDLTEDPETKAKINKIRNEKNKPTSRLGSKSKYI